MLYSAETLPFCQLALDEWQLIKVSGVDNQKFLQGQLTADVSQLSANHFLFAAHCDPKGKVRSNMLLFKRDDDIFYIVRKSVYQAQLNELKKFAVFSKVTIEPEVTLKLMAIAGQPNDATVMAQFSNLTDSVNYRQHDNISYLKINAPTPRYIIVGNEADLATLPLPDAISQLSSTQWMLLDMQANYPIIDAPNMNEYLPQAFNLQNMDAISFDKGCYCGQEMVARAQYRGINKRGLFLLKGISEISPIVGESLEQQMGENWRDMGRVLACVTLSDNTLYVQAILNNDTDATSQFRVKNSNNILTLDQSSH